MCIHSIEGEENGGVDEREKGREGRYKSVVSIEREREREKKRGGNRSRSRFQRLGIRRRRRAVVIASASEESEIKEERERRSFEIMGIGRNSVGNPCRQTLNTERRGRSLS